MGEWSASLGSRAEWTLFINDHLDDLGSDAWEWAGEIGDIKPMRTRLHLLALKLAFGVIEMPVELEAA